VGTLDSGDRGGRGGRPGPAAPEKARGSLGIVVQKLTPEERKKAQIVSGGAMVTEVDDGPGHDAGLLPGDILLTIAGNEIDGPDRLAEVVKRLEPGRSVPVLVQRRGQPTFLALEVPKGDAGK